jgi:hypothetical protein
MTDRDPIDYCSRQHRRFDWLLLLSFLVGLALIIWAATCHAQTFTINDTELAKLSWADVLATAKHQGELFKEEHAIRLRLEQNIIAATAAQTEALNFATAAGGALTAFQKTVDDLALHDRQMTDKVSEQQTLLAKKDFAILRLGVILGGLILAIGVYLVAKFYFHLPI